MKTLSALVLACALPVAAIAQNAPASTGPSAPAATTTSIAPGELAALEQFLNLSDAELAQLQQAIARLRAMTAVDRAKLRDEIVAFRRLPEPQRRQLRQGWGAVPPDIQAGWRDMMHAATPERRAEIQSKLQSLPPDEKAQYRRALVEEYLKVKPRK
ncbi:DUF3106 domain-containing protein [Opitutus sp. ER46]|uniref:DUF3106 domain-containing protein n=1 Tax=Opitutus sp. ER46 TaxID=2161864 RepID=UPI000D2FE109|nr:DUF3106 domain-containing protein [Opitutus sp. ER46]PTY00123.1 hypothetical protein DB354_02210 [Opitutus sp. ER46]